MTKATCGTCGRDYDETEYVQFLEYLRLTHPDLYNAYWNGRQCPDCFSVENLGFTFFGETDLADEGE